MRPGALCNPALWIVGFKNNKTLIWFSSGSFFFLFIFPGGVPLCLIF